MGIIKLYNGGGNMFNNSSSENSTRMCISCSGTGKIDCECSVTMSDNICFTCAGEGQFTCPICEGTGIF